MTEERQPFAIPQRPDITFDWGARGNAGDRRSSVYGGPIGVSKPGGIGWGYDTRQQQQPSQPDYPSREQVTDIGKTKIEMAPDVSSPVLDEELMAPDRTPGFFEGMLGGLVEAFTGIVPDPIRGGVVRGAELVGEVLDLPGEALGHIPINQLFGLENTEQAFEMLMKRGPMTADKRQVMAMLEADPTEADWYMSQYLRAHAGDYASAKGLPQLLANLIRPDATIQERFFMALGVPSQFVARNVAGFFGRAQEVLMDENLTDPALLELRARYQRGEFGPVGSEEALGRLNDEIVTAGYGWSNDPFIGMLAEIVTDPIIVASMGTGLAAGALRTGALARRAANVARLAREGAYSADNAVQGAVRRVDMLLEQDRAAGRTIRDTDYDFARRLRDELGEDHDLFKQATEELRTPERGVRGTKDYYAVKLERPIEAAAKVSWALNEPFSIFGKDGIGGAIQRKAGRNLTQGIFSAYGYDVVGKVYDGLPDSGAFNRAMGHAIAYTQRSMMQGNLVRMLRMRITDERGRTLQNANLPDTLSNPDSVYDRMLGYVERGGKRIRNVSNDDLNLEAQQGEIFARRTAKQYEPDVQGIDNPEARARSYERQMTQFREDAAHKLARAADITLDEAVAITKNADAKMLSLIDYAHWGRTIQEFVEVRELAASRIKKGVRQAGVDAAAKGAGDLEYNLATKELDSYELANRATLVGENELTMQRAIQLLDDLKRAATEEDKVRIAQAAVERFEVLHQNFYEKTRITSDADFIDRVQVLLKDGLDNERFVSVLSEDVLKAELPELAALRDRLHGAGAPYEVGLAPARDRRWAPVTNEKGELVGFYPWMDVRVTPEDVNNPTTFQRLRTRLMTPIRGENIMQESRRKFTQTLNREFGLGRASSQVIWDVVRKRARDQRITMRGFQPSEFRAMLDDLVDEGRLDKHDAERLGYRGLAKAVAIAMEGDLAMVGLTSKATGIAKTRTAAYQNYIGTLAEKIYPLVRFNLNPLFQMQEYIEPYFFNVLRGIKPGFKWTAGDVAMHQLLDEFNMAERLADGFEAREFMMAGQIHAHKMAGPGTDLAKVDFGGVVATKKRLNYYMLVKRQFGDAMYEAFEREMPGQWGRVAAYFNEQEAKAGRTPNLSRGDIAERWLTQKGGRYPDNPWVTIHHYDGAVPDDIGQIRGITTSYLAKNFGYADGAALRAAAADPLNTAISEWKFREQLVSEGYTSSYAARAWEVVTGPTVDEVLDGFEGAYADAGLGFHRPLAEALLHRAAISKGISLEEYVARKFGQKPEWVDRNARLPLKAYTQLVDRLADEYQMPAIREGAFYEGMLTRAQGMLPPPEAIHDTQQAHVNAARALQQGFTYVDEVTETMPPARLSAQVPYGNPRDAARVDALAEDMRKRGWVGDPIQITYYAGDRMAIIGEGNHRLAAARKARLDEVPITVIRYEGKGADVKGRNKPKPVRGIEPDDTGYTPGNMRPSQVLEGEPRPPKSPKRVARNINVEGFRMFTDGPSVEDFISVTQDVLDDQTIQSVARWYPEVAPVIAGIAKNMDDTTVRAFAVALNESNIDIGGPLVIGDVIDDAIREEIGARMLMAWGATQVQTSPRDGFQYTLAVLDRVANANRIGAKGVGSFSNQKAQFAAMLSDWSGFLSKEGVPTSAAGTLNIKGLGAKLHDFIDSLLGNTSERSFIRGRKQYFTRGDGTSVPMAPGAMDIWMGRDFGFVDSPLLGYIAERIAKARKLTDDEAMTAAQLETGFFYQRTVTKQVLDEDTGEMVSKQVVEPAEEYRARKAAWEAEHQAELKAHGLERLQEVWGGTPTAAEYEAMLEHYNRLADDLNRMDNGNGWMGRGYNSEPWTVADVQAVAWMRIQQNLDIDPGGPNNMFYQNSAQVSFEVLPGENTPLAEAAPMFRASDDAKDLITSEVMHTLVPIIEEATGVQMRKVVPGMGGWNTGTKYTLSPSTYWEMLGSPEAIDDALDSLSFLTQQDMVFATTSPLRVGGKTADVSGDVNHWSVDFVPSDDHPLVLEKLANWIEEKKAIEWNGHMVTGRAEGNNAIRTVYSPAWDSAPTGYTVIPDGTDLAGFESMTQLPPDVARMLEDGSWAREAGMDMDVPVTTERQLVRSRSRNTDFGEDAARAQARIDAKEAPEVAYREELGRSILDGLRARGRGDLADALVGRHMATVISAYDAALEKHDGNAWSVGRGRAGFREAYGASTGKPIHLQRRNRVWLGATKWSRDVDAAQRIIRGEGRLSGRRGGIVLREGRADITTVPHELFHLWSDDLDPSGVKTVHDAFFESDAGKRYLARGGTRPTGRGANNHLLREAEEWAAAEFERYMATGVAPNGTMNAAFNDYADWYNTHRMFVDPDPKLDAVFQQMTPEMHRGPKATYNVDEYRLMEAARVALLRAEEEAFRVHYYRRGRNFIERSINHPYLGLYPASYMWGKVLPELMRFLVRRPFGVDAPFAGLQMANHVYEAIQLEMNTDDGSMADFIEEFPEALRFIQLMLPGTPWDIPVNVPAWTRRIAQDAWQGKDPDYGRAITDTAMYAFGPGRAPQDVLDALGQGVGAVQRIMQGAPPEEGTMPPPEEPVLPRLSVGP